jgi:hypothetical protein
MVSRMTFYMAQPMWKHLLERHPNPPMVHKQSKPNSSTGARPTD